MNVEAAERYDAWYHTPRGAWIGEVEFALLARLLAARPGEQVLDVGSGTGYFTRRCARELFAGLPVHHVELRSAVFLPSGGAIARAIEPLVPERCALGALLAVTADVIA